MLCNTKKIKLKNCNNTNYKVQAKLAKHTKL